VTSRLLPPPEQLPDVLPHEVVEIPAVHPLVRVHDTTGTHARGPDEPRWFGPLPDRGRFDHHPAGPPRDHRPDHGVLYAACRDPSTGTGRPLDTVLAEWVQEEHELMLRPGLRLVVLRSERPLRLLDLRTWAQRLRAGTHLSTAAHQAVQQWAHAIRRAYRALDGVLYVPSTGGESVAIALHEQGCDALAATPLLARDLRDPAMLPHVQDAALRLRLQIVLPGR